MSKKIKTFIVAGLAAGLVLGGSSGLAYASGSDDLNVKSPRSAYTGTMPINNDK